MNTALYPWNESTRTRKKVDPVVHLIILNAGSGLWDIIMVARVYCNIKTTGRFAICVDRKGGGGVRKKKNKGTVPEDFAENFSWNHCYFLTGD